MGSPGGMRVAPGASLRGFRGKRASGGGQKKINPEGAEGAPGPGSCRGRRPRAAPLRPRQTAADSGRGEPRGDPPAGGAETQSLPPAPEGSRRRARLSPFPRPGGPLFPGESRPPPGHLGHGAGPGPPLLPAAAREPLWVCEGLGGCFWGPPLPVPSGDLGSGDRSAPSPPAGCPYHREVPRPAWRGRCRGQGRVLGELVGRRRAPGERGGTATLPASLGRGGRDPGTDPV